MTQAENEVEILPGLGSVVEFLDMVGEVYHIEGETLFARTSQGDTFRAPARVCTVHFSALPAVEEAAAPSSPLWYDGPANEADVVARQLWAEDIQEVA